MTNRWHKVLAKVGYNSSHPAFLYQQKHDLTTLEMILGDGEDKYTRTKKKLDAKIQKELEENDLLGIVV